ncbi:MAG: DUF6311 domain-containing protein [Lachnospiraceae bacterium]|nr:DUF6311 domain-containing protein [Lachnospiraceae bacterium]
MNDKTQSISITDRFKSSPRAAFLLGCLAGLVFFLAVFGGRIIDPTYTDWLLHSDDLEGSVDLTQHYLGWVFYRNSPWQFPFGLTEGIYSSPVSVIYTDSIPLFAFIFKLLSPVLPAQFQYFGLYGLLCYCLMGGFGALLVHRVCKNTIFTMLAAVLFICNPVMLNRMYLHTALAGHFIVVAGLCLYFYHKSLPARRLLLLWTVLISCGTLINAYFTPMLYGLLFFAVLGEIRCKNATAKAVDNLVILGLPPLLTAFLCYCFGMFYGNVPAAAGGLEVLSFNLNGFFNPLTKLTDFHDHIMGYTDMNYSRWLPPLPMSTAYQNEGFAYLGVGVMLLFLMIIMIAVSKPLSVQTGRSVSDLFGSEDTMEAPCRNSLLFFMIICLVLALSPVATFGENELYHLPLPGFIHDAWSSFRSTARFIWPVYYCLITMILFFMGRLVSHSKNRSQRILFTVLMSAAVILQLFDLSPGYIEKHGAFSDIRPYRTTLSDPMWDELGEGASHIIFYPPTEYGLYEDGKTSVEFEIYALKHGLTLSNTYMSRNLCSFADEDTYDHFNELASGSSCPDIIYVFFDCMDEADLPDPAVHGLKYYKLDKYTVAVSTR